METILIIQGILIALLVWRVIHLGNLNEKMQESQTKMLEWKDAVERFQNAQVHLNGFQRDINSLLATEVDNLNLIVKDKT